MRIKGIVWIGAATEDVAASASFFSEVLGLKITTKVPGFVRLTTENGDRIELFGPDSAEHDDLDTGPVAGFWVDDLDQARRELLEADMEGVTDFYTGPDGHRWFYFRDPSGMFYELCEHPIPRPTKADTKSVLE
jgi:catechol 2,3-dioxygenase-like lactoylglutathione lyase family enzyme